MQVQSKGQEDPLEKKMATHMNTLAWEIPWTEDPGKLIYDKGRQISTLRALIGRSRRNPAHSISIWVVFTQVYMCMKVHQAVSIKFVYFTIFRSFLKKLLWRHWASLIAQLVKNPPATQETLVQFLGREDPLEKG